MDGARCAHNADGELAEAISWDCPKGIKERSCNRFQFHWLYTKRVFRANRPLTKLEAGLENPPLSASKTRGPQVVERQHFAGFRCFNGLLLSQSLITDQVAGEELMHTALTVRAAHPMTGARNDQQIEILVGFDQRIRETHRRFGRDVLIHFPNN